MRRLLAAVPFKPETLARLVDGLALANLDGPRVPPLYSSGIRYRREPKGKEQWLLASEVVRAGAGDCEDLTAYRLAELWRDGSAARSRVTMSRDSKLAHVLVEHADGSLEDPSALLGMPTNGRSAMDDNEELVTANAPVDEVGAIDTDSDDDATPPPPEPDMAIGAEDLQALEAATFALEGADMDDVTTAGGEEEDDDVEASWGYVAGDAGDEEPGAPRKLAWRVQGSLAALSIPLANGQTLTAKADAQRSDGGPAALAASARRLLQEIARNPAIAAVTPPGAPLALAAISRLAELSPGDIAKRAKRAATDGVRRLLKVFS